MVYCAGKLIENLKLFCKSNRPHFLWVYRRDNPLGMLREHEPIERVVNCLNILEKAGTSLIRGANSLQLIYTLPLNSKFINKRCVFISLQ